MGGKLCRMLSWGWDDDPAKKLHIIGPEQLQKALETAQTHRNTQADICKAKLEEVKAAEQRLTELVFKKTPLPTVQTAKRILAEARKSYHEAEQQQQEYVVREGELQIALNLLADAQRRREHRDIHNDISMLLARCKEYKQDRDDQKQDARDEYEVAADLPLNGGGDAATLDDVADVIPDIEDRQQMWLDETLPNVSRILNPAGANDAVDPLSLVTDSAPSAPEAAAAARVDDDERRAAQSLAALME